MDLDVSPLERGQTAVFENLFQLYIYDFSDIAPAEVSADDGRFAAPQLQTLWDEQSFPFLLRVDGQVAGFALVRRGSRFGDAETWDMNQFFVLRAYRRRGVGALAAARLFSMHLGRWEVRQILANTAATAFWHAVIDEVADGEWAEVVLDDERWRGPVQSFRTGGER